MSNNASPLILRWQSISCEKSNQLPDFATVLDPGVGYLAVRFVAQKTGERGGEGEDRHAWRLRWWSVLHVSELLCGIKEVWLLWNKQRIYYSIYLNDGWSYVLVLGCADGIPWIPWTGGALLGYFQALTLRHSVAVNGHVSWHQTLIQHDASGESSHKSALFNNTIFFPSSSALVAQSSPDQEARQSSHSPPTRLETLKTSSPTTPIRQCVTPTTLQTWPCQVWVPSFSISTYKITTYPRSNIHFVSNSSVINQSSILNFSSIK